MAFILASSKDEFLSILRDRLLTLVEAEDKAPIARFNEQFFGIVSLNELLLRHDTDLLGCTLSFWRFFQSVKGAAEKLRVFNPDTQQHGWQSTHTIVELVHQDSPFLVDTVRMELKRQGYSIHTLQNSVMQVVRDAKGELLTICAPGESPPDSHPESVMYIEIDRCASASELKAVQAGLKESLAHVRAAVSDFEPMKAEVQALIKLLKGRKANYFSRVERDEAVAYLEWLLDNHFTFLGYEQFAVHEGLAAGRLGMRSERSLGVPRLRPLDDNIENLPQSVLDYLQAPLLLSFAKASRFSRVHRPAYPDYVSVREVDEYGQVLVEHRFMGLFTSRVYTDSVDRIPYLRRKVDAVRRASGFDPHGHLGKELDQTLQVLPRDDLFQMSEDELRSTALGIVQIQERNQVRIFLRQGNYGRFWYCLAFVPREIYSTDIRIKIQQVLMDRLQSSECEFWTNFSESVLARTQFILRVDPKQPLDIDPVKIEQDVIHACRSWQDDFNDRLLESLGEAKATEAMSQFTGGFPAGYSERFTPATGVVDLQHLLALTDQQRLGMSFYQPLAQKSGVLHCKLYHLDEPLPLSDVMPILENLGLRVLGEFPFCFVRQDGRRFWIHDFEFTYAQEGGLDIQEVNELFREAFIGVWSGQAENDGFNRLVLLASMPWRDVALLRAYARYLKQIRLGFELPYIANTLASHSTIAHELVRLFKTRFYLARKLTGEALEDKQQRLEQAILGALDEVAVLNEDRILRRYLDLIKATLRTNFYQSDSAGQSKDYISFKFDPQAIPELPLPRPMYEIFVYSPRFEGVHLRGGKVARGGLRWSDREEDYRTEVLGLVKAQQVKNAVIVPVGAKGGFVPRRLPAGGNRDEIQQEAITCYRLFIQGLLDLTDNLVEGQVVPPAQVVRHDEDDPYLVVAADKGTATFSDIANEIAAGYGFWLGDAFASGGSAGYDHKKMGITARGAWVSVQRHFRERGINVQQDPFTVIGIGDMGGDVFGNGMLMSRSLKLVAAFNHQHIFIDPDPDAERSFDERQRLFDLPRSSWADYNRELISEGGGIFDRSLKQISLTPQMKRLFDIQADKLTPAELIHSLLKAPVDLIWNGGIGTYVKAASETHADVGDKANDVLRVNGRELRCRVVGEGGNLGMTQLGRVEFCLNGGATNTDFIDNAGGVDCSDHEVNIKILLNEVVAAQDMTGKQRNKLLASMTDAVAELVLGNNYKQTQAISLAQCQARQTMGEYRRFITEMENSGKLSRALEFIPDDEQLAERVAQGKGLTRAELSVLISYSKADLKERLIASDVPEDSYVARELNTAFPATLVNKYASALRNHRLRREIIATQLANNLVNHMGITFLRRLEQSTGALPSDIAKAYVVARDVFRLMEHFAAIEALDHQVPAEVQMELMDDLTRLGRRATRWFIRNRRGALDPAREVEHFAPRIAALAEQFDSLFEGPVRALWEAKFSSYVDAGVPDEIARLVAGTGHFYTMLGIIEAADATGQPTERVAQVFFSLGSELQLPWFAQQVTGLPVDNHWQALARESYRDDLDWQIRTMTVSALQSADARQPVGQLVETWVERNQTLVQRWRAMLIDLKSAGSGDYPMVAVAMRELLDLAQNARQMAVEDACSS
ncbi:NAD-glutamate dehydrogenase [Pseudomonas jilinensis]|uniref:NAD-glutamate dehydrogenase n=1 Tax=Pseudomonas jilinensis TaxID=2078689 RepID=A0A396S4A8_9PSED|nr:NAD-glutamate dehydrogenase [Pseudomonas jilinensis]RHW20911.1 NAD-glutamate dehydrogenase [Pseudomonas jilinensis]